MKYSKLILFLLHVACACTYQDDEQGFVEVQRPTGEGSSIDLVNYPGQVIELFDSKTFSVTITPQQVGGYTLDVFVDGIRIVRRESEFGAFQFVLKPTDFQDGTRELRIVASHYSKSNSFAGTLNLESVVFERKWQLNIDNAPPAPIGPPMVYIEDGKSMIRWNPPVKRNFKELIIFRTYYTETTLIRDSLKVSDFRTEIWHDNDYVGGRVGYSIDIKGFGFYVKGRETRFDVRPVQPVLDSLTNPPVLSWSRSLLYGNDLEVSFAFQTYDHARAQQIAITIPFGESRIYELEVRPKLRAWPQYHSYRQPVLIYRGVRIPSFAGIGFLEPISSFVAVNRDTLYVIDSESAKVIRTKNISYGSTLLISPNNQSIYLLMGRILTLLDPISLEAIDQIDLSAIVSIDWWTMESVFLTNDDHLVLNPWSNVSYLINLKDHNLVLTKIGSLGADLQIAPDGETITFGREVFRRDFGLWPTAPTGILAGASLYNYVFLNESTSNLIYDASGGEVLRFNISGSPDASGNYQPEVFHLARTISDPIFIDGGKLCTIDGLNATLYSLNNFSKLKELPNPSSSGQFFYFRGNLIHSNGFIFPNF